MFVYNLMLFILFLYILIKCARYSIRYSSRIARALHFPEFVVSFMIVALISVLPESTISIISAINGKPELGLGTLIGSNIADLTLVFGLVALFAPKVIKVKSKILENNSLYLILLLLPLALGFDGRFSRFDGLVLLLAGALFYFRISQESHRARGDVSGKKSHPLLKNFFLLVISLGILIASAFLTVKFAVNFAHDIKVPEILIGLTILAVGTCLPELVFSIQAVRKNHDELALGDLLGTVVTDATIILGVVALIAPFSYDAANIHLLTIGMFLAGVLVIVFMKSEKSINKFEGILLIFLYLIFICTEMLLNKIF